MQVQHRTEPHLQIQDIRTQIHAEMEHAYLSRWLPNPVLESLQLILASAMARAAGLSASERETLISTLMLIYHGLAMHDEIETLAAREDERYRQLGVLAGDYYSSKYYRLLAEAGLVPLVGTFARAIQTINEAKAELERDPLDFTMTPARYLELHTTIHGTLLHSLRTAFVSDQLHWDDTVTHLVRASILAKEWQRAPQIPVTRTMANLSVWQRANAEERKWWKQVVAGKSEDQNRLVSLHVKYGTSSTLFQQVEDEIGLVEHAVLLAGATECLEELRTVFDQLTEVRPIASRLGEEA
ncbi:heptaprenyl diphosphate synthase component 1 [Tumebacillus permanentifrigoris]|uniref:heptaprenyl diphosphate synthase component 1 n=1 Tax=Tumebacillus permanentifrigoris TaxID=378543 RepID=UPI0014758E71|nr:heptaprenyl diphosphate synthase component 1 [Tumebacillus permanentifrigoris]